jgi:hypothetical protein
MICQECKLPKGCGCTFVVVPDRSYAVCPDCAAKLKKKIEEDKNDQQAKIVKPNVQGV